jgi:hypothetical protein
VKVVSQTVGRVVKRLRVHQTLWLSLILTIIMPLAVAAATTISQGYSTNDSLSIGSLVSLDKGASDQVVASTSGNVDSLLGVVINSDSSLLSLSNGSGSQVQVATSGIVSVLVSDINGVVVSGDEITASPVKGVGMKATSNAKVVGVTQSNMSDSSRLVKSKCWLALAIFTLNRIKHSFPL